MVLLVVGMNDVVTSGSVPLGNGCSEEDTVCDATHQLYSNSYVVVGHLHFKENHGNVERN
jgi:hypothetical protein